MSSSNLGSTSDADELEHSYEELSDSQVVTPQHLLRHISCIQIKNLTPFPARDDLTTALSQPAEQSQFTAFGKLSDDLDVALFKQRSRRISTNSIGTIVDNLGVPKERRGSSSSTLDYRGRKRTMSSGMLGGNTLARSPSLEKPRPPPDAVSSSGPTIRPNRQRTTSMASLASSHYPFPFGTSTTSRALWPDTSQIALEKVLQDRLVETFVTLSALPDDPPSPEMRRRRHAKIPGSPRSSSPDSRASSPLRGTSPSLDGSPQRRHKPQATSLVNPSSPVTPSSKARRKTESNVVRSNGAATFPSFHSTEPQTPYRRQFGPPPTARHSIPSPPNYISDIHHPSTNPSFPLDPCSGYDVVKWTNLAARKVSIQVWGKVPDGVQSGGKGKDKWKAPMETVKGSIGQWKALEEWNVNLDELVPLSDELASQPSQLPSNTLVLTLSPPGQAYYLPPQSRTSNRPASHELESHDDPEVRSAGDLIVSKASSENHPHHVASPTRSHSPERIQRSKKGIRTSVGWPDLVKLATMQSVILDTQRSLAKIIREIDKLLRGDGILPLVREISEREMRVQDWKADTETVNNECSSMSERIRARRESVRARRDALARARDLHLQDLQMEHLDEGELSQERNRLETLHKTINPVRISLITTLSFIFPIDLLSGPDLLYTILSVPLPIPLGTNDPAPPLSLPSHKEVNEDVVATALGYAAFVVHLVALYLGRALVYPVTFIGSRSLVRDGISAMVGPRMFPLFSKGVDTYRFEYGVFLLNKNIELLMSDRNLRALDMRHTLPNLKNLLLTLTDGEGAPRMARKPMDSPVSSLLGLDFPSRPSTPHPPQPASSIQATPSTETIHESSEPPAHEATTPTTPTPIFSTLASFTSTSTSSATSISNPTDTTESNPEVERSGDATPTSKSTTTDAHYYNTLSLSKMSKPFFGGLSGFLRSRYPSQVQVQTTTATSTVEINSEGGKEEGGSPVTSVGDGNGSRADGIAEGDGDVDANDDEDEEEEESDRRTLRDVAVNGVGAGDERSDTGGGVTEASSVDAISKELEKLPDGHGGEVVGSGGVAAPIQ